MDITAYTEQNWVNHNFDSPVPPSCEIEPCVLGVDEAGRGPVLGPMVYGIAYCPVAKNDDLKALGVADSKTLSEEKRESFFKVIDAQKDYIGWSIKMISPLHIANSMYKRPKVSLNEVSHNAAAELIKRAMDHGANIKQVFVDTVGDPAKYQAKLEGLFPTLAITVSKKADALFPTVSAASICAKVARDKALREWKFPEKTTVETWGSGYPGDSVTKNFLVNSLDPVFGFPNLVRFSWSTAEKIIESKCVPVKWFDDDEESKENAPSVLQYFAKKRKSSDDGEPKVEKKRHFFFADRHLKRVDVF